MREIETIFRQLVGIGLLFVVIAPAVTVGFVAAITARACAWLVEATYEFVETKLFNKVI